ncbi:NUDIX hydrolase [Streptomyces sp. NPDC046862]|uniref:NUDIX hydrolase n=1 Tax=Streptomyces sp. NPDC046862 TaxID=3154603 RepID=UPI0034550416
MDHQDVWARHGRRKTWATPRFTVWEDDVTTPDGRPGRYDWIEAPDSVRVAAFVDGHVLVVEQHHYLVGVTWQLPGGGVDAQDRTSEAAGRRELAEETGYHEGHWTDLGSLYPLPGLSPARVHLWQVREPVAKAPEPEPGEADLIVRHLEPHEAVAAALDGRIACAPSAALLLRCLRS